MMDHLGLLLCFFFYYGADMSILNPLSRVFVRLSLLRDSGYKMLLQGGEFVNEDEDSKPSQFHYGQVGTFGRPNGHNGPGYSPGFHGHDPYSLEGRALSALSRFGENAKMVSDPMWLNRTPQFPPLPGIEIH